MEIAIMSDSHDNIWNIRKAVDMIKERKPELIIHCGDFIAPFSLKELNRAEISVHGVFGNNDGDRYLLTQMAHTQLDHITLHGMTGSVQIGEFRIGFAHEPVIAKGLAVEGNYHLVCYGHTHQHHVTRHGNTVILNPGEIMGKDGTAGFCVYDIDQQQWEQIRI